MEKYKIAKCFDCEDMPYDLMCSFIENFNDKAISGCYVQITLPVGCEPFQKPICDWVLENGATPEDRYVLMRYWAQG